MIPKECKRLAEVDFPIAIVSQHAAHEKSVRRGHPSTLHLWWARRPLAACRAILLGLLLPDPCDSLCPEEFKKRARNILPRAQGSPGPTDADLRAELFRFIGDFANWTNSTNQTYLGAARGLVGAAYPLEPPLVVDPFAGGGSIPLEALRLGCDAFASDLNPVAYIILKTVLEEIPRHERDVMDELLKTVEVIKTETQKRLHQFYPIETDGSAPLAYLWARTIVCDSCGADIPLVRAFWLSKKAKFKRALRHKVVKKNGSVPKLQFEIFEPNTASEVPAGNVHRAKAVCLSCNSVMPPQRVKTQLKQQRGGADVILDARGQRAGGATLLVVVIGKHGGGRDYRLPQEKDFQALLLAHQELDAVNKETLPSGLTMIPNEPTPAGGGSGAGRAFGIHSYGMTTFADLFTARQKVALATILHILNSSVHVSSATKHILGLALSRFTDIFNALCRWESTKTQVRNLFTRQAISIVWDFAEPSPLAGQAGDYATTLGTMLNVFEYLRDAVGRGQVKLADCIEEVLPTDSASVWFTDPPYYDAIPYSDLADFFFVWLKRSLPEAQLQSRAYAEANGLCPKEREAVQDETKICGGVPKDRSFFEAVMAHAFATGRKTLDPTGIGCVVFAHKTTEGWEALLTGICKADWVITGSWPISTESATRLRARESAALATSVHLICRPRPQDAPVGDWAEVLRELPKRVGDWIEKLQNEGVRGADLVFACIGPAMEIYSRYRRVEDAEGREIPLGGDAAATEPYQRGFLWYVWETVGRMALEQVLGTAEARARNGGAGALEEDSRLTALFLWTLQATEAKSADALATHADEETPEEDDEEEETGKKKAGYTMIYDVARRFAQPLGIHLDQWERRIIETDKGLVRLLPVGERTSQLFGDADAAAMGRRIEEDVKAQRNYAFAFMQEAGAAPEIKIRKGGKPEKKLGAKTEEPKPQQVTTLDRVHAAMLLQAGGQTNGLRALLREEQQRGPDFVRLANALSALYPKDSEEKRLLDAMLLAVPR